MKWFVPLMLVLPLKTAAGVHAATVFQMETLTGHGSATMFDGDTLEILVRMISDTDVLAVQYDVVFPTTDWLLVSRDYGSYGWTADASFFDQATPRQTAVGYPFTVDAALYPDGDPGAADFHQATGRADSNALVAGTYTIEKWVLGVPLGTAPDTYSLTLSNTLITEGDFDELAAQAGSPFQVTVRNDIPEPGTLSLVLLGLAGIGVAVRRRRREPS